MTVFEEIFNENVFNINPNDMNFIRNDIIAILIPLLLEHER